MAKVVKGRIIPVDNTKRTFGSALHYLAIQVENEDGKGERCLLFTQDEINIAELRAKRNPEDLTKKGFFLDFLD